MWSQPRECTIFLWRQPSKGSSLSIVDLAARCINRSRSWSPISWLSKLDLQDGIVWPISVLPDLQSHWSQPRFTVVNNGVQKRVGAWRSTLASESSLGFHASRQDRLPQATSLSRILRRLLLGERAPDT